MIAAYIQGLKQYTNFSGRTGRREFWLFQLVHLLLSAAAVAVDNLVLRAAHPRTGTGLVFALYILLVIVPNAAIMVRRMHDINKSGWWVLLPAVPFLGSIWQLVLFARAGDPGENRFGAPPVSAPGEVSLS